MKRVWQACEWLGCMATVLFFTAGCGAPTDVETKADSATPTAQADELYPLGDEMALIARDLADPSYAEILAPMRNMWDRLTEYERLDNADTPARFAAAHGGVDAIQSDPELLAAYERRQQISSQFLALLERTIGSRPVPERTPAAPVDVKAQQTASDQPITIEAVLVTAEAERYWPQWRGPRADGTSYETGLPTRWSPDENVRRVALPGAGNSSPVIWGERIYLTAAFEDGRRRALVGLRRGDSEVLFVRDAPPAPPQVKIQKKTGYAAATPVTDGERVILFLGNVGVVAYDMNGEQLLWQYELPPFEGSHGTAASPILWQDLVILCQEQNGGPSLGRAIDKRSGEERWRFERDKALGWCTPIAVRFGGEEQLLWAAKLTVLGIDPATGEELWHCPGPTREVVPTLVYGHGMVYTTSGRSGPTLAIRPGGEGDISAESVAWRSPRGGPHVPSPVLWKDLLYLVNDTGILTCLDALTGEKVYQQRLSGRFTSSLVAGDDLIYITNEDGETFVVRYGREFEQVSHSSVGESVLASAAILDGQILLRGEKHLFIIGERRAQTAKR